MTTGSSAHSIAAARLLAPSSASLGIPVYLLLLIAAEIAAILVLNHGVLSYTLDDPYIHLALARRLQAGTYGINPGEFEAPSSSILWPLLLAAIPASFPGWVLLPLFINVASVLVIAAVFVDVLGIKQNLGPWKSLWLALSMAVAMNLAGLATSGMEHGLQVALAVVGIWGLIRLERGQPLPQVAMVALVLGPLVRYENLAITVPACLYLCLLSRWRQAFLILVPTMAGVALFSIFLVAHGLSPLPTSVLSKAGTVEHGFLGSLANNLRTNLLDRQALSLALPVLCTLPRFLRPRVASDRRLAGLALAAAALHLIGGRFGWYARYEIYIVAAVLLIVCALYREKIVEILLPSNPNALHAGRRPLLLFMLCAVVFYRYAEVLLTIPLASHNIYLQQMQMAHFTRDYWRRPVGVNDLGAVALASDSYVLDYAGLGSQEALHDRALATGPQWMDTLAQDHGIGLAMIYPTWFKSVPDGWTLLAKLHLNVPRITVGDCTVGFYATAPAFIADLRAALERYARDLPDGASLEMLAASQEAKRAASAQPICARGDSVLARPMSASGSRN